MLLAALVGACAGGGAEAGGEPRRPLVMTTFTVLADMTRVVAGDLLRVESITKVGAEIHGYEPTPDDLRRADGADLILDNGLGLEAWFAQFVERVDAPHVVISEGVTAIPIADDAYAGRPNPHAWMSPLMAVTYVDNIAAALSRLDPPHAATYQANAAAYRDRIAEVHHEMLEQLAVLPPGQRALVSCEGAFTYLTRDAGLIERYLWAVNAEGQATPRRVAETIEYVRANGVPAVFCESTVSDSLQRQVARESGARFAGTLYVDSLSETDGPVPTYLDLLRHDVGTIVAGLLGRT
jgi:manganese transport system substrate-binding protein